MLYPNPNTAANLSTEIRDLLVDELGKFKNGLQAIFVIPPQAPVTGSGIHIFIGRQPTEINGFTYRWNVNLFLYGDINDTSLIKFDAAITKMRQRFPRRTEAIMSYREGMLPQAFFGLLFNRFAYSNY